VHAASMCGPPVTNHVAWCGWQVPFCPGGAAIVDGECQPVSEEDEGYTGASDAPAALTCLLFPLQRECTHVSAPSPCTVKYLCIGSPTFPFTKHSTSFQFHHTRSLVTLCDLAVCDGLDDLTETCQLDVIRDQDCDMLLGR